MHVGEIIFIVGLNFGLIFALHLLQKRSIEQRVRRLKNEVQELEDLVEAIIEEFEEISNVSDPHNRTTIDSGEESSVFVAEEKLPRLGTKLPPEITPPGLNLSQLDPNLEKTDRNLSITDLNLPLTDLTLTKRDLNFLETELDISKEDLNLSKEDTGLSNEDVNLSLADLDLRQAGIPSGTPGITLSDPKHQRIYQLWKQGVAVEEIARQLGTGRGEVQLILGIYRRS